MGSPQSRGAGATDWRGQGSGIANAQGAGPSEARLPLRGCSRSLVRQACLIPRSPVVAALTRVAADLTSGQAPLVSLGSHRTRSGAASLRSALPPARLAPLPCPLQSVALAPPCGRARAAHGLETIDLPRLAAPARRPEQAVVNQLMRNRRATAPAFKGSARASGRAKGTASGSRLRVTARNRHRKEGDPSLHPPRTG